MHGRREWDGVSYFGDKQKIIFAISLLTCCHFIVTLYLS